MSALDGELVSIHRCWGLLDLVSGIEFMRNTSQLGFMTTGLGL